MQSATALYHNGKYPSMELAMTIARERINGEHNSGKAKAPH